MIKVTKKIAARPVSATSLEVEKLTKRQYFGGKRGRLHKLICKFPCNFFVVVVCVLLFVCIVVCVFLLWTTYD